MNKIPKQFIIDESGERIETGLAWLRKSAAHNRAAAGDSASVLGLTHDHLTEVFHRSGQRAVLYRKKPGVAAGAGGNGKPGENAGVAGENFGDQEGKLITTEGHGVFHGRSFFREKLRAAPWLNFGDDGGRLTTEGHGTRFFRGIP